jgi:hypothetical protein
MSSIAKQSKKEQQVVLKTCYCIKTRKKKEQGKKLERKKIRIF